MSVEDFCMKLDSFAILGLKGLGKNDNEQRAKLKSCIRELVTSGLCKVVNNNEVKMSWLKYEELIVIKQGAVLEGWPNPTFNPNNLGIKELRQILATLRNGTCAWRKLTDEECRLRNEDYMARLANGDINVRDRKKRSDAGKKRNLVSKVAGMKHKAGNGTGIDDKTSSARKRPRGSRYVSSDHVEDGDSVIGDGDGDKDGVIGDSDNNNSGYDDVDE